MELILLWLGLSIAVGAFASIRRNRSGFGWFLLAVILSPLLAGIFVAILKPNDEAQQAAERRDFDQLPPAEQARLRQLRRDLEGKRPS